MQGLTPVLLQEYLHRLETRKGEVLQALYLRAVAHYSQAPDQGAVAFCGEMPKTTLCVAQNQRCGVHFFVNQQSSLGPCTSG